MAKPFPIELVVPSSGTLSGDAASATIEITIDPFHLGNKEVDTPIALEEVSLPTLEPAALSGSEFRFPSTPDEGYIDGSFYLVHAHHPVDVTRIKFGPAKDGTIAATIDCSFQFDFEGLQDEFGEDYENANATLEVVLAID